MWSNVCPSDLITDPRAGLADHTFISCKGKFTKHDRPRKWTKKVFKNINYEKLKFELDVTDWSIFNLTSSSINEKTDAITDYINFCEKECTESSEYLVDENNLEITNEVIKHARRKREQAFKSNNSNIFEYWSKVVEKEIQDLNGKVLEILKKTDSKKYWGKMKTVIGKGGHRETPLHENITPNVLNEFFLRYEETLNSQKRINDERRISEKTKIFNESEVENLLNRSKNKHSRGHDGLSSQVLRRCSKELVQPMKEVLNHCLENEEIPEVWKKIKITPILKENKRKVDNVKQMRPIGQTPSMLKILEYYLKDEIEMLCAGKMDQNQFGYKQGVSACDAICLVTCLSCKFLEYHHSICRILFLDYSSAFNTVNRNLILEILKNDFSAPDHILSLLSSYFNYRTQFVQYSGIKSEEKACNTGVIQGAVLSPILFNIVTNSLTSHHENVKIIKYADDVAVISKISNSTEKKNYIDTINYINDYSERHRLILNPEKTKEIVIKNQNFADNDLESPIEINSQTITQCIETKYLGVIIDNKLNFKSQISNVMKTINQKFHMARNVAKRCANKVAVADYINSCIIPVLLYSLHTYISFIDQRTIHNISRTIKSFAFLCGKPTKDFLQTFSIKLNSAAERMFSNIVHNSNHPLNEILSNIVINTNNGTKKNYVKLPKGTKAKTEKCFIYVMAKNGKVF